MKIFVLEDDDSCYGVIQWLQGNRNVVQHVKNLEDTSYYLEYEEIYKHYDKFLMDASVPAASILHPDDTEADYNGLYNGIDYITDNFKRLEIAWDKVAIFTAYALQVEEYLTRKYPDCPIRIINKNDRDLTKRLQEFLNL